MLPAVSVNKHCQLSTVAATMDVEPSGNTGCKNIGYGPQICEVHIKEMISVSPDSCIFPYMEKG